MDKRQLRQSAVAAFMQSLEHLDELLGDTTETVVLDEGTSDSDPDRARPLSQSGPNPTTKNTQTKR